LGNSIGKKTKKNIQDLAQESFERIKKEPGEVARSTKEQLTGIDTSDKIETADLVEQERKEQEDREKSKRLMGAHRQELKDIKRAEAFEKAQEKILEGKEVNILEIPGLTKKQKESLRKQKEAVSKAKEEKESRGKSRPLAEPSTKPKRGLWQKAKRKIEQMKTRVETRFKSMG
jgi:hypothetical protein